MLRAESPASFVQLVGPSALARSNASDPGASPQAWQIAGPLALSDGSKSKVSAIGLTPPVQTFAANKAGGRHIKLLMNVLFVAQLRSQLRIDVPPAEVVDFRFHHLGRRGWTEPTAKETRWD